MLILLLSFFCFPPSLVFAQERIISLAPSVTEIIYHLGAETTLVARSDHCNYPREVQKLPSVGSLANVSLEKIISLKPTHIIAVSKDELLNHVAKKFGVRISIFPQRNVSELLSSVRGIAEIVSKKEAGHKLAEELSKALNHQDSESLARPSLLLFWESIQEASVYAAGRGSLDESILEAVGLSNVLKEGSSYQHLNIESIVALKPEILLVVAPGVEQRLLDRKLQPFLGTIVKLSGLNEEDIIVLNNEAFIRPGPRTLFAVSFLKKSLERF